MIFTAALSDLRRQCDGSTYFLFSFFLFYPDVSNATLEKSRIETMQRFTHFCLHCHRFILSDWPYRHKNMAVAEHVIWSLPILSLKYIRLYILSFVLSGGSRDEATSERINKRIFPRSLREQCCPLLGGIGTPLSTKYFAALRSVLFSERAVVMADGRDWVNVEALWKTSNLMVRSQYFTFLLENVGKGCWFHCQYWNWFKKGSKIWSLNWTK